MIACVADAKGDELTLDTTEIEDARLASEECVKVGKPEVDVKVLPGTSQIVLALQAGRADVAMIDYNCRSKPVQVIWAGTGQGQTHVARLVLSGMRPGHDESY